jgi:hypothetical protein
MAVNLLAVLSGGIFSEDNISQDIILPITVEVELNTDEGVNV